MHSSPFSGVHYRKPGQLECCSCFLFLPRSRLCHVQYITGQSPAGRCVCPCSRKALRLLGRPGWQQRNAGCWHRAISEHRGAPSPTKQRWHRPRCHRRRIPIRLQAHEGKNQAAGDGFRLILRRKKQGLDQGSLVSLQGGGDAHAGGSRAPRGTATPRSILGARRQPKASAAG